MSSRQFRNNFQSIFIIQPFKWTTDDMFIWRHLIIFIFFSSAFGDIKIIEVNDLFVKLVNSSPNQELEIGNHILQQNINGKPDSMYHFPPNITLQANSTVTVSIRYQYYKLKLYRKISLTQVRLQLSTRGFFITHSLRKMGCFVGGG